MVIDPNIPSCGGCEHSCNAFCALAMEEKSFFSEGKKDTYVKKGQTIFKERHFPTGLYAVYKGKVKISKLGEEGKEQIVRFAKSGDLIGYRSLLSEDYYKATATAIEDCKVCHIPKNIFFKVLTENKWLYLDLIKKLAEDLRNSEERIISISQKTVKERIAETLIILYHEFGMRDNKSIDVKLTRKEIGNIAGSTIETTIRTLSEFKKKGYIDFDGKKIIINSIPDLISIANIHH